MNTPRVITNVGLYLKDKSCVMEYEKCNGVAHYYPQWNTGAYRIQGRTEPILTKSAFAPGPRGTP